MSAILNESVEAQATIKKTLLQNYNAGGSAWKEYTDEELKDLNLAYLIDKK